MHAGFGRRAQQTDAAAAQPSLRSKLRELYKRVHPDLFQNHETARLANERSFKLLQVLLPLPIYIYFLYIYLMQAMTSNSRCFAQL